MGTGYIYFLNSKPKRLSSLVTNIFFGLTPIGVFHTKFNNFSPNWINLGINWPFAMNKDCNCLIGSTQNGKGIKVIRVLPIGKSLRFETVVEQENLHGYYQIRQLEIFEVDSNLILASLDEAGSLLFFNISNLKLNKNLSLMNFNNLAIRKFMVDETSRQILLTIEGNDTEYKVLRY
jgi:hypothetical protein